MASTKARRPLRSGRRDSSKTAATVAGTSGQTAAPVESEWSSAMARRPADVPCNTRSPEQVMQRLDRLIATIRSHIHVPALETSADQSLPSDVLIVAHGHILRAFAMRWIGKSLLEGPSLLLEAGGVGTLRHDVLLLSSRAAGLTTTVVTSIIEWKSQQSSWVGLLSWMSSRTPKLRKTRRGRPAL